MAVSGPVPGWRTTSGNSPAPDRRPYKLFLQLKEIEHHTTRILRSQSNGSIERLHGTLLDEHFRVMLRKLFNESIEAMQPDFVEHFVRYNTERLKQGPGMKGKIGAEVFIRCLPKPKTPKGTQGEACRLNQLTLSEPSVVRRIPYLYTLFNLDFLLYF